MAYPSGAAIEAMAREYDAPAATARIALRLGLTWEEINEIRTYGRVLPGTATYWAMVRRQADA
jgi:hypothetical protein